MANTAFHRNLTALGAVTPEAIDRIAQKVNAGVAVQLSGVQTHVEQAVETQHNKLAATLTDMAAQLIGVQAHVEKVIQDKSGILESTLTQNFDKGISGVLQAVERGERRIGRVSKEAFGPLIGLNQAEGIATDQTPDCEKNNEALKKLSAPGDKSAFGRWSESLKSDAGLQRDFSKVFRKFEKGDLTERAERCVEIHHLRARVLRHFQEGQ